MVRLGTSLRRRSQSRHSTPPGLSTADWLHGADKQNGMDTIFFQISYSSSEMDQVEAPRLQEVVFGAGRCCSRQQIFKKLVKSKQASGSDQPSR